MAKLASEHIIISGLIPSRSDTGSDMDSVAATESVNITKCLTAGSSVAWKDFGVRLSRRLVDHSDVIHFDGLSAFR